MARERKVNVTHQSTPCDVVHHSCYKLIARKLSIRFIPDSNRWYLVSKNYKLMCWDTLAQDVEFCPFCGLKLDE